MKQKAKINKNKLSKRIRQAEQNWLYANIDSLVNTKIKDDLKKFIYKSAGIFHDSFSDDPNLVEDAIGNFFVGPETQIFMDLEEEELSYLIPKIRLFRVNDLQSSYTKANKALLQSVRNLRKGGSYSTKIKAVRKAQSAINKIGITPRILEFKFPTHQDKKRRIIEQIQTGGRDRVQEAGIVSCDWALRGKNPAEAERLVEVDMKLFFSSIDTLLSNGDQGGLAPAYLDLIDRYQGSNSAVDYSILLEVGYEIPDEGLKYLAGKKGRDSRRYKKIIEAVKNSNRSIKLKFVSYDIQFSQQGHIELSIKYIGSLNYEMSQIFLFKSIDSTSYEENQDSRLKQQQKQKDYLEKQRIGKKLIKAWEKVKPDKFLPLDRSLYSQIDANSTVYGQVVSGPGQRPSTTSTPHRPASNPAYAAWLKTKKNMVKIANAKTIAKLLASTKQLMLINKILKKGLMSVGTARKKNLRTISGIKQVVIKKEELAHIFGLSDKNTFFDKEDISKLINKTTYSRYLKGSSSQLSPQASEGGRTTTLINALENAQAKTKSGASNQKQIIKELKSIADNYNENIKKDNFIIEYCFLGDIFDAMVEAADESGINEANQNYQNFLKYTSFLFGNVEVIGFKRDGSIKSKHITLSDVPVSYNYFNAWFIKNVIDSGQTKVSLIKLFNKFLTDLLPVAFSSTHLKKQEEKFKQFPRTKLSITYGTLKTKKKINFAERMTRADLDVVNRTIQQGRKEETNNNTFLTNVCILDCYNNLTNVRKADVIKDNKNGIFHLFLGRDNGLVREINFSRADQKFMEEAMLTTTNLSSQIEAHRRIYNADIQMFGNSNFIPGQKIYINADSLSRGRLAINLGLGGYYLITEVNNQFNLGSFNTQLKAVWVGDGSGKGPDYKKPAPPLKQAQKQQEYKLIEDLANKVIKHGINKLDKIKVGSGSREDFENQIKKDFQQLFPKVKLD